MDFGLIKYPSPRPIGLVLGLGSDTQPLNHSTTQPLDHFFSHAVFGRVGALHLKGAMALMLAEGADVFATGADHEGQGGGCGFFRGDDIADL